jgi:hypothetical protein
VNNQFAELSLLELTGNLNGVNDDPVDLAPDPPDPLGKVIERRQFDAALAKGGGNPNDAAAWDELLLTSDPALTKRVEERTVGGDRWEHTYVGDELVSARVVNGDGGPLQKRAAELDFSDIKADSKIGKAKRDAEWAEAEALLET